LLPLNQDQKSSLEHGSPPADQGLLDHHFFIDTPKNLPVTKPAPLSSSKQPIHSLKDVITLTKELQKKNTSTSIVNSSLVQTNISNNVELAKSDDQVLTDVLTETTENPTPSDSSTSNKVNETETNLITDSENSKDSDIDSDIDSSSENDIDIPIPETQKKYDHPVLHNVLNKTEGKDLSPFKEKIAQFYEKLVADVERMIKSNQSFDVNTLSKEEKKNL